MLGMNLRKNDSRLMIDSNERPRPSASEPGSASGGGVERLSLSLGCQNLRVLVTSCTAVPWQISMVSLACSYSRSLVSYKYPQPRDTPPIKSCLGKSWAVVTTSQKATSSGSCIFFAVRHSAFQYGHTASPSEHFKSLTATYKLTTNLYSETNWMSGMEFCIKNYKYCLKQ